MIDRWLNRFEDEDGDGVPDWIEATGLVGIAIGINVLAIGVVALAAVCA